MNFMRSSRHALAVAALLATAACDSGSPTEPEPNPEPSFIRLESDAGDYIGQGQRYEYTRSNAVLSVHADGNSLSVMIDGDEWWFGDFQLPSTETRLEAGTYANLTRFPFHSAAAGGLSWFGEGRGCNTLTGSVTISEVEYQGEELRAVDLTFEQRCENSSARLRGTIHWRADDESTPPGPVNPAPSGLWTPPAGALPNVARALYLASEPGDYIGGGNTYTYTGADVVVQVTAGHVYVQAGPWNGNFQAMEGLSRIQPGYYGSLTRYPFHNPAKGGLTWSGDGRGCNNLTGWFVVDRVTYTDGRVTALDLRFEQHCESHAAALRGALHWTE